VLIAVSGCDAAFASTGSLVSVCSPLRIHFITEDDPLYVVEFFDEFFALYPREEMSVVGISIQEPFNESRLATAKRVLSLYGPVDFARLSARVAARKLRGHSIARLALDEGAPLVETTSVNDPDYIQRLKLLEPDVIVSVAAPEIFRSEILETPRLGCINIHSGRLPTYRGMMPTFWQMRSGERQVTVTVHEMAAKLDAGAVLGTAECAIEERDSLERLMIAAKREGARLMIRVLRDIAAGTARPQELELADASYFSFPSRADLEEFRRLGHSLL
jgi:methionyl-tRNA formyltransferase